MARDHRRIQTAIWNDKDFQQLTPMAQATYWAMLAYDDLSWCGVIDYIPKRLVKFSVHMTPELLAETMAELRLERFVVVDEEEDELLIRSYVRHDGLLKMPNVAQAMARAIDAIRSPLIRQVVITELARAYREDPAAKGWTGVRKHSADLMEEIITEPLPDPCEKGLRNPSGNPSAEGSDEGSAEGSEEGSVRNPSGNPSAKFSRQS